MNSFNVVVDVPGLKQFVLWGVPAFDCEHAKLRAYAAAVRMGLVVMYNGSFESSCVVVKDNDIPDAILDECPFPDMSSADTCPDCLRKCRKRMRNGATAVP